MRKMRKNYRKGVFSLQYAFLIAVLIGTFIAIQAYLKRSMQGQLQAAADQLAEQYAYTLTRGNEHFESVTKTIEWNLPGPFTIIRVPEASYSSNSERHIRPLDETWLPGDGLQTDYNY